MAQWPYSVAASLQPRAYDMAMRLPMLTWSTALAMVSTVGLEQYVRTADPELPIAVFAVGIAMRLAVIAYLVILAGAVVLRRPPIGKSRGAEPRISAMVGTFLLSAVVLFPRRDLSILAGVVSTLLVLAGEGFAIFVLTQLRHSFSIMPEARELVTSGVYRLVRHPLYLAEEIAALGSVMQFLSIWTALLLIVHILFQLRRIRHEEAVLTAIFPRYATHREKTARLIPGIY